MDNDLKKLFVQLRWPILLTVFIWIVEFIEFFCDIKFSGLGIFPRQAEGLLGILLAPLIHSDWTHLISNTWPLLLLTSLLVLFYERVAIPAFIFIWIIGGFFVWVFARESYHVGASGLIYGLAFFLLFSGIFRGNVKSIILSLLVLTLYSGLFLGFVPKEGVSWESHIMGAFIGIVIAFVFKNLKEIDEEETLPSYANEVRKPFFESDVFQKTKLERWIEQSMKDNQEINQE